MEVAICAGLAWLDLMLEGRESLSVAVCEVLTTVVLREIAVDD